MQNNIFILGLGITGKSAAQKLASLNNNIYIYDDKIAACPQDLLIKNVIFCHYDEVDWTNINYIMVSPGINIQGENAHKIRKIAKACKIKLVSDIELFVNLLPKAKLIGITGTNGKSTTSALIHHIFKDAGKEAYLGGNIGVSVFDLPLKDNDNIFYILELSSYQLDLLDKASFNAAIILNITPDHIDRHGSYGNYVQAKFNIFKNERISRLSLISEDIYRNKLARKYITEHKKLTIIKDYSKEDFLAKIECSLFGNIDNLNAAIAIGKYFNLSNIELSKSLSSFKSLPHRLEYLGEIKKVKIFNDSKATNAESTLNAVKQFKNITLIIGGVPKEGGINLILPYLNKVKRIFIIGAAKEEFKKQLDSVGYNNYYLAQDLEDAYKNALTFSIEADSNITLLFSPAAASFDMWKNFVERGNEFKNLYYKSCK
ncbi:MAG: UDP-N-acetylmuramoyl-L-alanine--D-glutamate ligase [Alphaproteobacteria bacterium]|jgi:UDP-N-acetylmuramoylalanine--D-glutamate ligase|nr:UDP-N-acetylmuramoyl-L-alanine--D-glutamate ligase [Alphaproteobacteria bacterium]MBT5827816.1 UDP-N-acetylmuramoyl-L-alanine--D-glutamate ligase [Alphaproteobacteria bacterium]